jgi:hypothetical protein
MIIVAFAILTNVSIKAQSIIFGEIPPCTGTELIGCDWDGPLGFSFTPDTPLGCQSCNLVVEYYVKGLNGTCDGNFAIQITRIFLTKKIDNLQSIMCSNCVGNLQNRFTEAYAKLFKSYEEYIGLNKNLMLIQQQSCTKWIGPSLEVNNNIIFKELIMPVASIHNFNPINFPDYQLGDQNVSIKVVSFVKVCNSSCCCYELESYWNRTDEDHPYLVTLYNGTPCSNVNYECTDGCSGGCEDLLFGWSRNLGMLNAKIGFSTKNVSSGITISPNPNRGTFTVELSDKLNGMLNISLADMKGTILGNYQYNKQDESFTTDLNLNYPNGSYIMLFEIGGVYLGSQKVIINK